MDYTSVLNVLEFLHSSNHWFQTNKELDHHDQSLFKLYRNRIVYLLNSSDSPDFLLIKRTEEQTALFLQYRRIHQFLPGYFLAFTEDKHTFISLGRESKIRISGHFGSFLPPADYKEINEANGKCLSYIHSDKRRINKLTFKNLTRLYPYLHQKEEDPEYREMLESIMIQVQSSKENSERGIYVARR